MKRIVSILAAVAIASASGSVMAQEWTDKDQSGRYNSDQSLRNITLAHDSPIGAGKTGVCVQISGRVPKALQGLLGKTSEQKEKEFALAAAQKAHEQGYNWVILSPLEATSGTASRSTKRWVTVGTSYGYGVTTHHMAPRMFTKTFKVRHFVMDCMALDDIAAYHLLFGNDEGVQSENPYKVYSVYDIDAALGPLVKGAGHRPLTRNRPYISDRRFRQPGQKEQLTAQLAVMRATERCMRDGTDPSIQDTRAAIAATDMDAVMECWMALAPQANSAGWSRFPLFAAVREAKRDASAYDTVSPDQRSGSLQFDQWQQASVSPYRWSGGEVWFASGSVSGGEIYAMVVGDGQLTATRAMDAAVFHFSSAIMSNRTRHFGVKRLDDPEAGRDYGLRNGIFREAIAKRRGGNHVSIYTIQPYADPKYTDVSRFDITAEKLRAYNALGPTLFGTQFKAYTKPEGY